LWDEDGENKWNAEKREEEHEDVPYLVEEDNEGELEFDEREQECHEPLEKDEEENPNRGVWENCFLSFSCMFPCIINVQPHAAVLYVVIAIS